MQEKADRRIQGVGRHARNWWCYRKTGKQMCARLNPYPHIGCKQLSSWSGWLILPTLHSPTFSPLTLTYTPTHCSPNSHWASLECDVQRKIHPIQPGLTLVFTVLSFFYSWSCQVRFLTFCIVSKSWKVSSDTWTVLFVPFSHTASC